MFYSLIVTVISLVLSCYSLHFLIKFFRGDFLFIFDHQEDVSEISDYQKDFCELPDKQKDFIQFN